MLKGAFRRFFLVLLVAGLSQVALALAVFGFGASPPPIAAGTVEVDRATGIDSPTCGAGIPCRSISYAVANRASSGDVVWVRGGVYTEPVTMRAGVVISGSGSAVTFIDGENVRGPMVIADSGVTASAVLRGFTVQHGSSTSGGGLYITGGASPVIADCVVSGNAATESGAGIYVTASMPSLVNVAVVNNAAARGAGLFAEIPGSSIDVEGSSFEHNVASTEGGGLFVIGSVALIDTDIRSNSAVSKGGGLYVSEDTTVTDSRIVGNSAGEWGGGLYQVGVDDHVTITGARFADNLQTSTADYTGGGGVYAAGATVVADSQIISNSATYGAGMYLGGDATLNAVDVLSNTSRHGGSGLRQESAPGGGVPWLSATDCTFSANAAGGQGGALEVLGTAALTRTTVFSNSARQGGGLWVSDDLTLLDCDVISNTALTSGGGVYQGPVGTTVISGGLVTGNRVTDGSGGGLSSFGNLLQLSGTRVVHNSASGTGGGVYVANDAVLDGVELSDNSAGQDGGGVYAVGSDGVVTIIRGRVSENIAGYEGGGLAVDGLVVEGTEITTNYAALRGGGMWVRTDLLATNVLLVGNSAPSGADEIQLLGESGTQTLRYLTIAAPTSSSGTAIYVNGGTVLISNTIVASHTVGIRIAGGTLSEDHNLYYGNGTHVTKTGGVLNLGAHSLYDMSPRFVDSPAGDFHLLFLSPARDAGMFIPGVDFDIDGDHRPTDPLGRDKPDIGCDEWTPSETFTVVYLPIVSKN